MLGIEEVTVVGRAESKKTLVARESFGVEITFANILESTWHTLNQCSFTIFELNFFFFTPGESLHFFALCI